MMSESLFKQPVRIGVVLLTSVSLLWFPWPLSIVLIFMSGLIFPPLSLMFGILADVLYYSGQGYYVASILGLCGMAFCYVVRHFVKTRIM